MKDIMNMLLRLTTIYPGWSIIQTLGQILCVQSFHLYDDLFVYGRCIILSSGQKNIPADWTWFSMLAFDSGCEHADVI